MIFKTTDTEWEFLNGKEIIEVREIDKNTYDYEEVGLMYECRLENDEILLVFADEIIGEIKIGA